MSKIYITADTHFGHEIMLRELDRPYHTVAEMDRKLIRNINDVVTPDDTLFILGDLTMASPERRSYVENIVRQINGKKILVLGNHDRFKPLQYVDMGFYQVCTHFELMYKGEKIWMFHDPAWANLVPRSEKVLCGHVHRLFKRIDNVVNVGVDVWDYKTVELDMLLETWRDIDNEN